jgi:hypothetical protein
MDLTDIASSSFFKPADYATAVALLVEPISVEENVRNEYNGQVTFRDEVTADITVWPTLEDLRAGRATVLNRVTITHASLSGVAKKAIGGATIARLEAFTTKYRSTSHRFVKPDPEAHRLAVEYYEQRRAQVEAAAAAAPPF